MPSGLTLQNPMSDYTSRATAKSSAKVAQCSKAIISGRHTNTALDAYMGDSALDRQRSAESAVKGLSYGKNALGATQVHLGAVIDDLVKAEEVAFAARAQSSENSPTLAILEENLISTLGQIKSSISGAKFDDRALLKDNATITVPLLDTDTLTLKLQNLGGDKLFRSGAASDIIRELRADPKLSTYYRDNPTALAADVLSNENMLSKAVSGVNAGDRMSDHRLAVLLDRARVGEGVDEFTTLDGVTDAFKGQITTELHAAWKDVIGTILPMTILGGANEISQEAANVVIDGLSKGLSATDISNAASAAAVEVAATRVAAYVAR